MTDHIAHTNILWAKLIVENLFRKGVDTYFISPGSRSTPLVLAIASHPEISSTVHFDERGSSFCALGYAKYLKYSEGLSKCKVAWVCTSGTALANALPAVIEASKSHTPLLLLTADRPPELKERGANQTIPQDDIFQPFLRWQKTFAEPLNDSSMHEVFPDLDDAHLASTGFHAGPVHLNLGFRKPLQSGPADIPNLANLDNSSVHKWRLENPPSPSKDGTSIYLSSLPSSKNTLAILGGEVTLSDARILNNFCAVRNIPLIVDSACPHLLRGEHICSYADLNAKEILNPVQQIIHLGERISSAVLQSTIEERPKLNYIHICNHLDLVDPGRVVTRFLSGELVESSHPTESEKSSGLSKRELEIDSLLTNELSSLSEASIVRYLCREIPAGTPLWIGNSLAIRQVESFANKAQMPNLRGSNRGVSGIDGQIASSTGFAMAAKRRGVLLIGDLGFLHDLNSLQLCRDQAMTIVVINNDGGGIFSILPIAEHGDVFAKYFSTPHGLSFEDAANLFGLDYQNPNSLAEFGEQFSASLLSDHSTIIEVKTDRSETLAQARHIRNVVRDSLSK